MKANHFGSALSKTPIEEKKIYEKKKNKKEKTSFCKNLTRHILSVRNISHHTAT